MKEIVSCISVSFILQRLVYDPVHIGRDCNICLERWVLLSVLVKTCVTFSVKW